MFEFLFSIRVSFLAVRVGRIPRRCAATDEFREKNEFQRSMKSKLKIQCIQGCFGEKLLEKSFIFS